MKKGVMKRGLSIILAIMMIFSSSAFDFSGVVNTYAAEKVDLTEETADSSLDAATDYGLVDNIQDGTILHCFCWKYNDIKAMLPEIAEAGFTSIQTSPPQATGGTGPWWWVYQPLGFYIGTNALGTKEDLRALCQEAENYGIKIIADIVANHLAGDHSNIQSDLKDSQYWHSENYDAQDGNRYSVTHGKIGMPDLNTENSYVQQCVKKYIEELKAVGVDGIRFDAAKHIGLPSEGDNFWPTVTSDKSLWYYGEILNNPGITDEPAATNILKEYTSYMSVTDSTYGMTLRDNFKNGRVTDGFGNLCAKGIANNKLVYWGESHDNWSNNSDWGYSWDHSQNVIDRAYAAAASRNEITALYFSRPSTHVKDSILLGSKGSTHFTSKEVAAVNHFHNAMVGQKDYYKSSNGCAVITREKGAVIVLGSGSDRSVSVENGGSLMAPGEYEDEITGEKFTVTSTTISGKVGSSGIAVIYNAGPVTKTPTPTISKEGGDFSGDTLSLTIGLKNANSGTYKIGNASAETYTSTKDITIGSDMAFGDSVTITLTATDGTQTETKTYTFTKVDKVVNKAYLSLPSGWSEPVYCYAYDSATEKIENAKWPGTKMTKDSDTGYFVYEIPENIAKPRVIFSSNGKQDPAAEEKGYLFETDGSWLYKDGKWEKMTSPVTEGKVTVKYVDASGKSVAPSKTLKGKIGSAYTTTAETVSGYTLKQTPANASGKYTKEEITVTYIYEEDTDTTMKIISDTDEGTTFDTETKTIKITIVNATSGTYSVDNGPVRTFAESADVIIGQGKIADSKVTVDVTATNGTDTITKTFTYNKKFSGKVVDETTKPPVLNQSSADETLSAASALEVAMELSTASTLASHYSTNGTGVGKEGTITIDGDAGDWSQDMLIAQGAAWDVANHWKGGHENCVLDTYALYAAWDNDNLYIGWQMVNTTDTWSRSGDGPLSDGGRVLDVPLILALSVDPSSPSMSNKNTTGGPIWGQKMGLEFDTHVDRLFYMSGKPGLGEPSMFKAVDAAGNTDYTDGCVGFAEGGIEYKMATTNISSSIIGLNSSDSPADVSSDDADWVDYKTFEGSAGKHDTTYDSFYEMKIPFSTLGISKDYVTSNGIGAMLVATRGESALDCIPYDLSMVDNATGDYSSDPSTSAEKDDIDVITAPLAKVGNGTITPTPTPPTPPTPGDDLTVNFGADRSSPQLNTTNLTLKAIASGGKAPYKYEFLVDGESVQASSSTDSYTWAPTAGTHFIKVTVTDSEGTSISSQKAYVIEGTSDYTKPSVTSFTADKTSATEGDTVKLTATAKDGQGALKYMFTATDANGEKTVISDYSSSASVDWKPSKGTYKLEVTVKDEKNVEVVKAINDFVVKGKTEVGIEIKSLTTDKDSGTAVEEDTVKLTATATGTGELQYKFTVISDGPETIIQDYSTSNECNWNVSKAGTYKIVVYVKDGNGNEEQKSRMGYVVNPKGSHNTIEIKTFNTDKASGMVKAGDSVQLSADVVSELAVKYRFTVVSGNNETVISDYGDNSKVTWKPQAAGKYSLYVYVKDTDGNASSKYIENFEVVPKGDETELEVKSINTDIDSGKALVGDTVKISAEAVGTGELQYRFTATKDGAEETIQEYGSSSVCSWKPYAAGTYILAVYVKDSNGNIVKKSKYGYVVNNAHTTIEIKSFTTDKASGSIEVGDSVKLSVTATSDTSVKYKFTALLEGEEIVISDYSNNDTVTWKPQTAGNYSLFVYVTDSDNNTVDRVIEGYTVKAKETPSEKVTISSFKINKASNSITVGQTVKMKAAAKGGSGKFQYQFVVKRGNEKNQTVRKYSTDSSCDWTPSKNGKYTLYVYVKDVSTGKVSKKSIKNYNIREALKIKTFSQSRKSGTAVVGDSVIIRVNATGGIGSKFYRYYYKLNGKKYKLKDYTTSKKLIWAPKKAGKYQLFVEATDDVGNKVTKSVNYVVIDKLKVKSLKADKSSIKAGDKVTLSASAAGGTKGYSYKFQYTYKNKTVTIKNYSKTPSVNFIPDAKGRYRITVYVKDAKHRKAQKTITINVK